MGRIVEKGTARVEGAGLRFSAAIEGYLSGGGQRQPLLRLSRVGRG